MNCKIQRNKINYTKEVQNLGNFLLSDKKFYNDIFIRSINTNKKDIIGYVSLIEKRFVMAKLIEQSKFDKFKTMWISFERLAKEGKARTGDLLEYIITKTKKPLKLKFTNLDYENTCKIYEDKGIANISSNNCDLDVVLYNLDKVEVDALFVHFNDSVEFLECKHDVNTFLFLNKNGNLDTKTQMKLKMFKEIKTVLEKSDAKYIFPSFVNPMAMHKRYIQKDYGFIEFVSGSELADTLFV